MRKVIGGLALGALLAGLMLCQPSAAAARDQGDPALAMLGLGKLSWRMSEARVRELYPSFGGAPPSPFGQEIFEWQALRTNGYRFAGCVFTLSFSGADDHLYGVGLEYQSGGVKRCVAALVSRTTDRFGAGKYPTGDSYSTRDIWWTTPVSALTVTPSDASLGIISSGPGSPYIRRQAIDRTKIPH